MMLLRRPAHRHFEYEPRFYNPDKDRAEHIKREMRARRRDLRPRKRIFLLVGLLFLILYLYFTFSGGFR